MAFVHGALSGHRTHVTGEETETWKGHLMCPGKQPVGDRAELKLKPVRSQCVSVNHTVC